MSKKTKYPAYSGGSININGRNVASVQKNGNTISSNYNMTDTEKNIYDSLQSNMESSLTNLFNISDPQRQEWQNQLDAIKSRGLDNINSIYTPLQNNLKNDIASRFGNLDNKIFLDKLDSITNNKNQAIADLATNIALQQDSLYNNELNNRMNLINMMNTLTSSINSNILNYLNMANTNSSNGNQYSQSKYSADTAAQEKMLDFYMKAAMLGANLL